MSGNRLRTLQGRLSIVGLALFAMIAGFGLFTIHLFNGFNELSSDLRQRWLPNTRLIGDLNNYTSDYRAAEGDFLLATDPAQRAATLATLADLGQQVTTTEQDYLRIRQARVDLLVYASFAQRWTAYRQKVAEEVTQLVASANPAAASAIYRTSSRGAYNAASDVLGALTALNVEHARSASTRTARAYETARALIIASLFVAAAMLICALALLQRLISLPLTRLAHTMRLLAANTTDIDIESVRRTDEIGEMARAVMVFRANAIELIQSQAGLAQQAAMLEEKLAYEQHLTRLQRNFVAMISHEFRTPLTAIDAHAQRMISMKDRLSPEGLAERAGRVRSAVQRMTGLLDNLLNSSRLMDGEPRLFFCPAQFDLAALLREVCAFHRETAPNAFISEPRRTSGELWITGDRKLLFQTFSNLLSNAIKYSPDNVVVHVATQAGTDHVRVTLRDQGLGIPAADLDSLFTRYFRGRNVTGMVGTGVGLYLARTVVQLHGGSITVDSEEGRGSCFTVSLPFRARAVSGGESGGSLKEERLHF